MQLSGLCRAVSADAFRLLFAVLGSATLPGAASGETSPDVSAGMDVFFVTATRTEREMLDVAADAIRIDREAIERSGAATIPELLRRQPGLFVTSFTTSPAGVTVESRGFNNGGSLGSSLLVLLDGRRLNEADTGNVDWALLPLDRVESIEILQGSASAIYGDNAVGGVINVRTRPYDGPRATLRGRYGRYDSGGGSLDAQLGSGPVSGGIFLNGFETDGARRRSDYEDRNAQGDLEWSPREGVRIGARGGWHEDERRFPGALSETELRTLGRRAADPGSTRDEAEVEQGFLQGWLEIDVAEEWLLSIAPHHREREDEAVITSIAFGPPTTFTIDTEKRSSGLDLRAQTDLPLGPLENSFVAGAEGLYEETDRDISSSFGTTVSDNRRSTLGVYVQDEVWLSDALLVSAGLRYDHARYHLVTRDASALPPRQSDSPRFHLWSPRASLNLRVHERNAVYGSYSRGFRLPNFDENAPVIGFTSLIPDLDPQISDAFEVGVKHESERLRGSVALYWMEVRDEILFDPFTFENSNLDRVRHRGLSASLWARLCPWLSAHASYTFDDVVVRDADDPQIDGQRMPITPRHRGAAGLLLELPFDVELGGDLVLVDERILSNDFDGRLDELDAYGVVDLLAAWRPRFGEHWEGRLAFALRNAFDERYEDFGARFDLGFPVAVPTAFFNPAAGRSYEVSASLGWRY